MTLLTNMLVEEVEMYIRYCGNSPDQEDKEKVYHLGNFDWELAREFFD